MRNFHLKLVAVTFAWTFAIGLAFYTLIHLAPATHGIRPHVDHERMSVANAGSQGGERLAELKRETQLYIQRHPDAAPDIREGKALAPVDFLNEELAAHGEKFRVRKVDGLSAEMYDVS
ncbi:MAG: hypothetical protein KDE55_01890 [Novosphingobium sp.]|nr:hypothetical protein [Novosphingobium sp.]